jgi:hypothetical protein
MHFYLQRAGDCMILFLRNGKRFAVIFIRRGKKLSTKQGKNKKEKRTRKRY